MLLMHNSSHERVKAGARIKDLFRIIRLRVWAAKYGKKAIPNSPEELRPCAIIIKTAAFIAHALGEARAAMAIPI